MLDIDMEFHRGILFVRLIGNLNERTTGKLNREVIDFIKINGIRNIVYNVSNLEQIDCYGINALLDSNDECKKNRGKAFLCGLNNMLVKRRIENSRLLNHMFETSDELSALNVINL